MRGRACRALAAVGLVGACCAGALALAAQDHAQEVLARARQAIGGQARLAAVTSLSVKVSSVRTPLVVIGTRQKPTVQRVTLDLELQILLPDKFLITRRGPLGSRQVDGVNGARPIFETAPNVQVVIKDPDFFARMAATRRRQLLRYLVAWLLVAPESYAVRFSDGGVAALEGKELNVVEVNGANDFTARLFFDGQSRLVMITYQDPPASAPTTPAPEAKSRDADEPLFKSLEGPGPPPAVTRPRSVRVLLADYRADDGILFPHSMTFESDGQVTDTWEIKRFTVNPALDSKSFDPR